MVNRHADVTAPASSNPSAFTERVKVLLLAVVGFGIACYLAAYQAGYLAKVWDPFFADGSRKVLHSAVSRMLPVPDASLGALGYLADFVSCAIGGAARWRTMPWLVLFYGAIVSVFGAAALLLAFLQPLLVHDGCTLCLISAAISLLIVWLARHEVLATLKHLRRR